MYQNIINTLEVEYDNDYSADCGVCFEEVCKAGKPVFFLFISKKLCLISLYRRAIALSSTFEEIIKIQ